MLQERNPKQLVPEWVIATEANAVSVLRWRIIVSHESIVRKASQVFVRFLFVCLFVC